MARRVILDTNVLVGIEREDPATLALLNDDDDVAIAAVTRSELLAVPLSTRDATLRNQRLITVNSILENVTLLDYSEATSDAHANLLAHVRLSGKPRGAHDLIIAAHARETGRVVVTADVQARFGELPKVETTNRVY